MVLKIISGGQTGADQAGLAVGKVLGLKTGGFIPKGRRTQAGPLPIELFKYWNLTEHSYQAYPPRTEANVISSDATIILGTLNSPGSRLTLRLCKSHGKPYFISTTFIDPGTFLAWCDAKDVVVLNVAGNREESNPGIFDKTYQYLLAAFGAFGPNEIYPPASDVPHFHTGFCLLPTTNR